MLQRSFDAAFQNRKEQDLLSQIPLFKTLVAAELYLEIPT